MNSLPDDWIAEELVRKSGRDAWAAIRGFLYQIRSTIVRWLELDQHTLLLCEYGEDIDHLRRVVDPITRAELYEHLLEQVKHSDKHVTLRSPQVLGALGNFYQTKVANQTALLRLRYTTNATPGYEQGTKFPRGLPGIEACRRIGVRSVNEPEVDEVVAAFRAVIESTSPLAGSTSQAETFEALRRFVAGASREDLLAFLGGIEWVTGQPEHDIMPNEVESRLVTSGLASPATAKRVSDRLTVVVLDILSRSGIKLLSHSSLIQTVDELELTEPEVRMVTRLERLGELIQLYLPDIASGVSRVEAEVGKLAEPIEKTHNLVAWIASKIAAQTPDQMILGVEEGVPPVDTIPSPPRYEADRSALVGHLLGLLEDRVWLHLAGGAGMGKTQLGRKLIARAGRGSSLWMSFTSSTARSNPLQYFDDRLIALIVSRSGDPTWWAAYRAGHVSPLALVPRMLRILGSNGILVLDDLPDLVAFPELANRISATSLACKQANVRLLTTGQRPLTPGAKRELEPHLLTEVAVPPMEVRDTQSMLQAAHAPAGIQAEGFAEILTQTAKGHPAIISAIIRWLEQRVWTASWESLIAVLTGAAAVEEKETALRQMVQLVPQPEQRELLCRLSLIGRRFGRGETDLVARVHPVVNRPGEALGELVGPWINRFDDESYEVSPLLSDAGRSYLATDLQSRVHLALARGITQRGKITTTEAFYAVVHLSSAKHWLGVATLLIHMLISVRGPEHAHDVDWVKFLFPPGGWPDRIPLAFRLMLRGLQVKVTRLSEDRKVAEELDADLDQLLSAASGRPDEQLARVMALLNAGPLLVEAPPARATRRALEAIRVIREHPRLFESVELKVAIIDLLWLPVARATDLADVRSISAILDDMNTEELREAFKSDIALQSCEFLADRCWLSMHTRPEQEQDWDAVLQALKQLEGLAQRRALEELRCMAVQAQAVVFNDYLGRGEEGIALLRGIGEPGNQDCRFFIRYRIARILDDLDRTDEAVREYENALNSGGQEFIYLRFRAYMEATVACGRAGNWEKAAMWARRGLAFASSYPKSSFR
jgi:hypothetical protein